MSVFVSGSSFTKENPRGCSAASMQAVWKRDHSSVYRKCRADGARHLLDQRRCSRCFVSASRSDYVKREREAREPVPTELTKQASEATQLEASTPSLRTSLTSSGRRKYRRETAVRVREGKRNSCLERERGRVHRGSSRRSSISIVHLYSTGTSISRSCGSCRKLPQL